MSLVDEFSILISVCYLLVFFNTLKFRIRLLKNALLFFAVYFIIAIISSLFGEVVFGQFILQLSLDLKPFIIMALLILCYDNNTVSRFEMFLKYILICNLPFVIWQIISVSTYDEFFSNGSHFGLVYTADGGEYSRAAGAFWFTGIYALFCSLSVGYFFSKILTVKESNNTDWFFLFLSTGLLTLSLSRGEIFSCIVSCILIYLIYSKNFIFKKINLVGLLSAFFIVLVVFSAELERWMVELGFLTGTIDLAPRAIFMQSALSISGEYFPFGAGLGSFGGKAAVDYDSIFFYKYLISHEWYFNYGYFLTDTFWPKVLAETGVFGAIFYLLVFVVLLKIAAQSRSLCAGYTLFALLFMLINSLSAPVLNDSFSMALSFFLFFGIFNRGGKE